MNLQRKWIIAAAVALLTAAPAAAQDSWSWNKAIRAGQTLEIKGINGAVKATAASGREVTVVARKSAKRSNPDDVTFKVVEHAGGVTICAMYPTPRGKPANECAVNGKGRMSTHNNDVTVDFEVRVPRGVKFTGRTVNGSVEARGLTADAGAFTVNGGIRLQTTGLARASTVNGSLDVSMGRADWSNELEFKTVNGSIDLALPDGVDADVSASMVNGSFSSDWPMTVKGKWGPKRVSGTIGSGGRQLGLSTVNGDIQIRRNN